MLSPGRQSPLNSFYTAVSSSASSSASSSSLPSSSSSWSLSSSSSVSSPLASSTSIKTKNNSSSLFLSTLSPASSTFSSSSLSLWPSSVLAHLLLLFALLSVASCTLHDSSMASVAVPKNGTVSVTGSPREYNGTLLDSERPQGDEPPRKMNKMMPTAWSAQPNERYYYLRAVNDQYLQIDGDKITGTKVEKPPLGILKFISHSSQDQTKVYLVFQSFKDKTFICMNNKSELYISRKTMPGVECFIEEDDQTHKGSLSKTYEFVEYRDIKSNRRRFLGFDCDPLPGDITRPSRKSSRFMTIAVSEAIAKEVLKVEGSSPKPKCESREVKRKKQRKKLRWRWCWNLNRIVGDRKKYYDQCDKKNKKKCTEENKNNPRVCVCAILREMAKKPNAKRAKRKCLVEKLTRWVKKKNIEPNKQKILQTAKELLPAYNRIARRMRQLQKRSRKKEKQRRGRKPQPTDKEQKLGNVEETQRKQTSPHNSSQHQQSTQQQNQHKKQQTEEERREKQQENSRLHQEKEHDQEAQGQNNEGRHHKIRHHHDRHRRQRHKSVKVNPVLKLYGYELYKNSTEPVLSTEFSQALASLSRRRKDRRKRRRSSSRKEDRKARRTASSSPG